MSSPASSAPSFNAVAQELCEAGRFAFARGWLPATSGNLSALYDGGMAITRSGCHTGELTPADILPADLQGRSDQGRPSAETGIHVALYERLDIGAVLHTHSPLATVLSLRGTHELVVEDYEIQKAFSGVSTHEAPLHVPIVPNDQDIQRLVRGLPADLGVGFLIAGHGLYTWGRDVADARVHLEALEFLFQCESLRIQLGVSR